MCCAGMATEWRCRALGLFGSTISPFSPVNELGCDANHTGVCTALTDASQTTGRGIADTPQGKGFHQGARQRRLRVGAREAIRETNGDESALRKSIS